MSTEARTEQKSLIIEDWWEPPMPPTDLIFDDGEPMESNRHRIAMNVLIRSINQAFANRDDFFAGGNIVNCLAFSWNGQTLVSGSQDKTIKI